MSRGSLYRGWEAFRRRVGIVRAVALLAFAAMLVYLLWAHFKTEPLPPPAVHAKQHPLPPLAASHERVVRMKSALVNVCNSVASGKQPEAAKLCNSTVQTMLSDKSGNFHPDEFHMLYAMMKKADDEKSRDALAKAWLGAFETDPRQGAAMDWMEIGELAQMLQAVGNKDGLGRLCAFALAELRKASKGRTPPAYMDLHALLQSAKYAGNTDLDLVCRTKMRALAGKGKDFPGHLAPQDIQVLAQSARKDGDAEELDKLAVFVTRDYLPQSGLMDALTVPEWMLLGDVVRASHSDAAKKGFAAILQQRLCMNCGRGRFVDQVPQDALFALAKDLGAGQEFTEAVVLARLRLDGLKSVLDDRHQALIVKAATEKPSERDRDMAEFRDGMLKKEKEKGLSIPEYRVACYAFGGLGNPKEAFTWPLRAFQRYVWQPAIADVKLADLNDVATLLMEMRLKPDAAMSPKVRDVLAAAMEREIGPAEMDAIVRGYALIGSAPSEADGMKLISALAKLNERSVDVSDETYIALAGMLRNKPCAETIEKRLMGDNETVNLAVSRVMAWQARQAAGSARDDFRSLRQFIARFEKIQAAKHPKGDVNARMELAKGYGVGLIGEPQRARGVVHLDQALASAETDGMRLLCLREIAAAFRAKHQYDKPIDTIRQIIPRMAGPEKTAAETLLSSLESEKAGWRAEHATSDETGNLAENWRKEFASRDALTLKPISGGTSSLAVVPAGMPRMPGR